MDYAVIVEFDPLKDRERLKEPGTFFFHSLEAAQLFYYGYDDHRATSKHLYWWSDNNWLRIE